MLLSDVRGGFSEEVVSDEGKACTPRQSRGRPLREGAS